MRFVTRRLLAATVAVAVATSTSVGASSASASAPAPPSATSAGPPAGAAHGGPALDFGPCDEEVLRAAGAECGTIAVPLDHRRPHGPTIDVAVSRLPAPDAARRRGVLLVNPGGPGAPGREHAIPVRSALGSVGDRYDVIGFDPRFVGRSSPITCGPTRFSDTFRSAGEDRAGFRESRERAADFARRCHARHADILPFAGLPDVARDMDVIRSALGERQISYFGVSGGTPLGAAYSQLFPDRVDRMVLDSSITGVDFAWFQLQGPAAEAALDEWAAWTAARDERYHLGPTGPAVRRAVEDLGARLAHQPVTIDVDGQGHRLDDNTWPLLVQRWLNHEDDNASLAEAVHQLVSAVAGQPVTPSPELAARLSFFDANDPMLDNGLAVAWANLCNGGAWPSGARPYWQEIQRSRRSQPFFGALVNNVRPCAFWTATSPNPPVTIDNAVPILMVQAERDNATPLPGARDLHDRLAGSRLVTADVRAHGVYGRATEGRPAVPCIDRIVNRYFEDGTLPTTDMSCG